MQAKHTPGPWTAALSDDARNDDRVTGARGAPVLRGRITSTEDAALIAAAPDMLAALELLLNVEGAARHGARLPGFVGLDVEYHFAAARAAIARATGDA